MQIGLMIEGTIMPRPGGFGQSYRAFYAKIHGPRAAVHDRLQKWERMIGRSDGLRPFFRPQAESKVPP